MTAEELVLNNPLVENQTDDPLLTGVVGPHSFTFRIPTQNELSPAWWSPQRDAFLRRFVMSNDYVATAIYAMVTKIASIPFRIEAKDTTVRSHVIQAERMTENMNFYSARMSGWREAIQPFLFDFLTQDNGAFMLIIAPGPLDGPITGEPVAVETLDSARCTRTGHIEYPVVYTTENGRKFKLHASRVMYRSQMPSPQQRMYGVGFCAVSRMLQNAVMLDAMMQYRLERMGKRPSRGLITVDGMNGQQVYDAFAMSEKQAKAEGLGFYSFWTVLAGDNIKAEKIDLSGLDAEFDDSERLKMGIYIIASALGLDARELLPSSDSGATRADAFLSHIKSRGKGPADAIQGIEGMFIKYVPPHLHLVIDNIDDEADRTREEINELRSKQHHLDLKNKVIDARTARELRMQSGQISESQFASLELADGRLQDGSDVLILFSSSDPAVRKALDIGVDRPTRITGKANLESIIDTIEQRIEEANALSYDATTEKSKRSAREVIAALTKLKGMYEAEKSKQENELLMQQASPAPPDTQQMPMNAQERTPEKTVAEAAAPKAFRASPPALKVI